MSTHLAEPGMEEEEDWGESTPENPNEPQRDPEDWGDSFPERPDEPERAPEDWGDSTPDRRLRTRIAEMFRFLRRWR